MHSNVTALLAGALYDRAYASQAVPAGSYIVPTTTYVPASPYSPPTSTMPNAYQPIPGAPMPGIVTFAPVAMQAPAGPDREQFIVVAHAL